MTNLDSSFCLALAKARREAKISQSELAASVGCKQSALSMFEQGEPTKLNEDVVAKLAERFHLEIKTTAEGGTVSASRPTSVQGFCPNPNCPSNKPYRVGEVTFFLPDRTLADPVKGRFCAMCGEVLEKKCPNCGAPIHAGAVCSLCGERYVSSLSHDGV